MDVFNYHVSIPVPAWATTPWGIALSSSLLALVLALLLSVCCLCCAPCASCRRKCCPALSRRFPLPRWQAGRRR
jgi:hypothetical protein